jgi:hypothetical protein
MSNTTLNQLLDKHAFERIMELSAHKTAITDELDRLKEKRPAGHHPDEIMAMLDTVPDLRPTLATVTEPELAEIFRAFDVEITYDKDRQILNLAATITPELLPDFAPNENDRSEGRSQINEVAGAGLIHLPATRSASKNGGICREIKGKHPPDDGAPY